MDDGGEVQSWGVGGACSLLVKAPSVPVCMLWSRQESFSFSGTGSTKRWALGCGLILAAGRDFTQPRTHNMVS